MKRYFRTLVCDVGFINSPTAYLVLCGQAIGPHFGRNQTIVLEGQVDNLRITSEYTIHSKLYEIVERNLRIAVPYQNAAEYDIWMTDERPSHLCKKKMESLKHRKFGRLSIVNAENLSKFLQYKKKR